LTTIAELDLRGCKGLRQWKSADSSSSGDGDGEQRAKSIARPRSKAGTAMA
jgi:hypothetical protein